MIYLDYAATTPVDSLRWRGVWPAGNASRIRRPITPPAGARANVATRRNGKAGALLGCRIRRTHLDIGCDRVRQSRDLGAARYRAHGAAAPRHDADRAQGRHSTPSRARETRFRRNLARAGRSSVELEHRRASQKRLRDDTQLVSIMHVNNETGVIQDIERLGALCRERDMLFHVDAAQSVGKLPIDLAALPIDLLSTDGSQDLRAQGHRRAGTSPTARLPRRTARCTVAASNERSAARHAAGALIVGLGTAASIANERMEAILNISRRCMTGSGRQLPTSTVSPSTATAEHGFPGHPQRQRRTMSKARACCWPSNRCAWRRGPPAIRPMRSRPTCCARWVARDGGAECDPLQFRAATTEDDIAAKHFIVRPVDRCGDCTAGACA